MPDLGIHESFQRGVQVAAFPRASGIPIGVPAGQGCTPRDTFMQREVDEARIGAVAVDPLP